MATSADIITLMDEEGAEIDFEVLDIVPYNGAEYAVLLPADDDSEQPEAVILELVPGQSEEDETLEGVSDESVLEAVFALFMERCK